MVERQRVRRAPKEKVAHKGCRTCVGCRRRADRSQLLRVVAVRVDDVWNVALSTRGRHTGRGAWLHPDQQCVDKAIQRRALSRAFPAAGGDEIDTQTLRDSICGITAEP